MGSKCWDNMDCFPKVLLMIAGLFVFAVFVILAIGSFHTLVYDQEHLGYAMDTLETLESDLSNLEPDTDTFEADKQELLKKIDLHKNRMGQGIPNTEEIILPYVYVVCALISAGVLIWMAFLEFCSKKQVDFDKDMLPQWENAERDWKTKNTDLENENGELQDKMKSLKQQLDVAKHNAKEALADMHTPEAVRKIHAMWGERCDENEKEIKALKKKLGEIPEVEPRQVGKGLASIGENNNEPDWDQCIRTFGNSSNNVSELTELTEHRLRRLLAEIAEHNPEAMAFQPFPETRRAEIPEPERLEAPGNQFLMLGALTSAVICLGCAVKFYLDKLRKQIKRN